MMANLTELSTFCGKICLILLMINCVGCKIFGSLPHIPVNISHLKTSSEKVAMNPFDVRQSPLMMLSPHAISKQVPNRPPSPSTDLYWIPNVNSHALEAEPSEGFFAQIRKFFQAFRTDPPRAVANGLDKFLARLGEATFHAIVEMTLDFLIGNDRRG